MKKTTPKCPRCGKEPAIVHRTMGVLPGKNCQEKDKDYDLKNKPEFYTLTKADRITHQRDQLGKDLIQPFLDGKGTPNPDFVKAYPEQRDNYYTPDQLKKI